MHDLMTKRKPKLDDGRDVIREKVSYQDAFITLYQSDVLEGLRGLPSESVHCCVTSPPYFGLRDYGTANWEGGDSDCEHKGDERFYSMQGASSVTSEAFSEAGEANAERLKKARWREKGKCLHCGAVRIDKQIGLEATPAEFVAKMVEVFEEVRRVLRSDGVLFLNLGDSYAGSGMGAANYPESASAKQKSNHGSTTSAGRAGECYGYKPKDLMLIPHRVAIALQDAGWWVRSDMPWVKRSAMPESVTDRPAKALEYIFLLTKSPKYYFDMEAVRVRMAESSFARMERGVGENHKNIAGAPGQTPHSMNKPRENVRNQPDSWKGSSFSEGKTAEHQLGRAQKDRDRSLPTKRNGMTGSLDETPAGGRNFRNSDLWYSSIREPHGLVGIGDDLVGLDVNPAGYKESHFATFPPKLIEPLIKAATSEKGVCAECGSPWERTTERQRIRRDELDPSDSRYRPNQYHGAYEEINGKGDAGYSEVTTTGWQKTCKCETDATVPATVLDPFAGAGTTLLVAKKLGRRSVGIELNPEYAEMAARRIVRETAMPLFDETESI